MFGMETEDIFINKKVWSLMSDDELSLYVDNVFYYYREVGFPYYDFSKEKKLREFDKLCKFDISTVIQRDDQTIVRQTMHGLGLAWCYFDHSWSVRCGKSKTPMEVFKSDKLFRAAICKRIKYGTYMSDSGIRKNLRMHSGAQGVSNFRPTAARAVYEHFQASTVWDMCAGYGGRLLGALSSTVVKNYIGSDPASETVAGLLNLADEFSFTSTNVRILSQCAEDVELGKDSVDLCFTSPPYFDWEKYSEEDTQSYLKYPDIDSWCDGFLVGMFNRCRHALRPDGHLAVNIAPVKSCSDLDDRCVKAAEKVGFTLKDTWRLALSASFGSPKRGSYKYEPIFIFSV